MAKKKALSGVMVDGSAPPTGFKRFLQSIEYFFNPPRLPKVTTLDTPKSTVKIPASEADSAQKTINDLDKTARDQKTTAVLGTVDTAITSVFGLLSSNSNRKIEEEKTRQLQVQLEGEQDADVQELLRKKLDIQIAAMNAAVEADRQKSRVVLIISLVVGALAALAITLAFKKKTKEIPNNQPIIIASEADFPQSNTS